MTKGEPLDLLGRRVAELHFLRVRYANNDEHIERIHEEHWIIRAAIEAAPAISPGDWCVKARAALLALDCDPDAECSAPGSFRSLAKQILNHVAEGRF